MKNKFNQEDKKKVIEFLNTIATNAEFQMKTPEIIKYFHLLHYMQSTLIPKIEANILEVTKITENSENNDKE